MEIEKCDLCGSTDLRPIFVAQDYITKERFQIIRCARCLLVKTNPEPEDLKKYYPSSYYKNRRSFFESITNRIRLDKVGRINRWDKGSRIIDIGCGRGYFLYSLKGRGWETYGIEISDDSFSYARDKLGLTVYNKDIKDCSFPDEYFDLVTLWHVFEHLRAPSTYLTEIHRVLKKDGILIIALPNFDSLQSRLAKERWFHLDVPRHLYHYTSSTLSRLLELRGFRIIKENTFSFEYDTFGMMQSILNHICLSQNLLFDTITKRMTLWDVIRSRKLANIYDLLSTLYLSPLLFLFSAISSYPLSIIGYGGTIEVYAKKNQKE